jgi:hypothetical protein
MTKRLLPWFVLLLALAVVNQQKPELLFEPS